LVLDGSPRGRRLGSAVLAGGGDYHDDQERAALHRELEASIAETEAGKLGDD
jgi:hypothetical protein